jgi:alpha-D-xyloside xylohydrolase
MLKKLQLILGLLLVSTSVWSQNFTKTNYGLKTRVGNQAIELKVYSPAVIRVIKSPENDYRKQSMSVVAHPIVDGFNVKGSSTLIQLTTKALTVKLNTKTGSITYYTAGGKLLMAEKAHGSTFEKTQDMGKATYRIVQKFTVPNGDAIYGLGQHQEGVMNYRDHHVELKQKNMEIAIPFILSSGGYGLFWDNYSTTTFDDHESTTTIESAIGDGIDYYFIAGGSADKVIAQMHLLTGKAPMFPKWAFGFWQSRERYTSQDELLGVVKKYRDLHVPLDGIVQDWQYWGKDYDTWSSTAFGNPSFFNPKQMVDSVHKMNAHMMVSVWPNFGKNTEIYKELDAKGLLFKFKTWPETPDVRVYDAFNPAARDVYWKYLNKNLFSIGIDGWWLDATEPEQGNTTQSDSAQTHLGSFKSVRNAFPLVTTQGVYEHQRKTSAVKRVFILTRSAFAGQQRNATATWSGDIQSSWQVFRKQISGGLNISLSGIPYWNTDIGGFSTGKYAKGINDPAFQELYTRWLQFACFTPIFRSHGTGTPREIYQFGKPGDWAYDAQEKFIKLRYRLLPYIYSSAWQVTSNSSTMMRALVMDFQTDKRVLNIDNEYLFGKSILVAPVTDSMYTKNVNNVNQADFGQTKTMPVYLPGGTKWVDFWTGVTYQGHQSMVCRAPINQIPLFVKAGSILPLAAVQQFTDQHKADTLEIRIFPGVSGKFTLYEDEGDSYNYEHGAYSTIDLIWNDRLNSLTISDRKGSFSGMLKDRVFKLAVVKSHTNVGSEAASVYQHVSYHGKQIRTIIN